MKINFRLDNDLKKHIDDIQKKEMTNNISLVIRKAIMHYWQSLFNPALTIAHYNQDIIALMDYATVLPGMSLAVIQSHLVRFPKVTPGTYKSILEHLTQQYANGTLKNAEATAYGLCKLAQQGRLPKEVEPKPQTPEQAIQPQPQAAASTTTVPYEVLHPFADYFADHNEIRRDNNN